MAALQDLTSAVDRLTAVGDSVIKELQLANDRVPASEVAAQTARINATSDAVEAALVAAHQPATP